MQFTKLSSNAFHETTVLMKLLKLSNGTNTLYLKQEAFTMGITKKN